MAISVPLAGAAIVGGAGYLSSQNSANAAKSAAGAQTGALGQALGYQQGIYGTATNNLQPYVAAGQNSLQAVLGALGLGGGSGTAATGPGTAFNNFTQTPAYQFPLQQGQLALQRQLASMGLNGSGAALKDATGYNQGYASQNYQNYLSQLLGLAGSGQAAAGTLGQIGMGISGQNLNTLSGIGQSNAAGIVGSSNALNSGLGGLIGSFTSPNTGNNFNGSAIGNLLTSLGQSSYGSSSGSPAALQQSWGIGSNQYVP